MWKLSKTYPPSLCFCVQADKPEVEDEEDDDEDDEDDEDDKDEDEAEGRFLLFEILLVLLCCFILFSFYFLFLMDFCAVVFTCIDGFCIRSTFFMHILVQLMILNSLNMMHEVLCVSACELMQNISLEFRSHGSWVFVLSAVSNISPPLLGFRLYY